MAYWLENVAIFHVESDPARAIQLVAAASALREQINNPRPPAYQTQLDERMAIAGLADKEIMEAVSTGSATDVQNAVILAGFG